MISPSCPVSKELNVPPYVIFEENSLIEMSIKYPTNIEELRNINGVGNGKANKNSKHFLPAIEKYVSENNIVKPNDIILKSTGSNSSMKLFLIQSIDRKLSFNDISSAKGITMEELINELEKIVFSGTKLDLNYYVDDILDDEIQDELHEYFIDSDSNEIENAIKEFDDIDEMDIRLFRIKFISELAN